MTTHETGCVHTNGMTFQINIGRHHFMIDAHEEFGGKEKGPTPKPLLLASLAGCTAMDIVSLLNKMRVTFSDFAVDTKADLNDHSPKTYDHMHLIYKIKIDTADRDKMEKAVNLSVEKYCGVHHMLAKAFPITHEIVYL